jgi:hypothetical protein
VLAELHGKFDPSNADNVDRSEDALTFAVFGAFRYLPRHALGALLVRAAVPFHPNDLRDARIEMWPQIPMPRWPGRIIEPDVMVVVGGQPIVFEAKLHSAFGLYPEPGQPHLPALHQLAVQYAAVADWAVGEKLLAPVVVAVTAPPERPRAALATAEKDLARLLPVVPPNPFRWLPWFAIAEVLDTVDDLRVHERTLVADLLRYMEKRGVRRVFKGFQPEDYWLLAAAQRVAADRAYPQIHDFVARSHGGPRH